MSDAESGYDEWKRKGRRKSQLEYLEFLASVNRILSAAEGK
jgi:hypothetical protein